MNYRQDLAAAHGRIAQLEREVAEARRESAPLADADDARAEGVVEKVADVVERATAAAGERLEWWRAWPFVTLVGAFITYAVRFGTSTPSELSVAELQPFSRGSLLCVAAGSAMMVLAYLLRVRADGESSVGQRVLGVLAALINAPLLVIAVVLGFHIGSMVLGIGVCLVMTGYAVWWLFTWIARGTTE